MKTLRISDGDMVSGSGTGVLETVDDIEKGSQDVARHLLCVFNSFFFEGNELLTTALGTPGSVSESMAVTQITEAINRLIAKQNTTDGQGMIVRVLQVRTRIVGLTTLVFLAEILFASGEVASVVNTINLKPTSLRQVNGSEGFVSI